MRKLIVAATLAIATALALPLSAEGERAGDFDHYVLSLSWSANWCAREGDERNDPQCDDGRGITWVVHGLWPQNPVGYPSYCRTVERDPTRGETAAMADVFGGAGAAFYQWKKHGRCSGLSSQAYYDTARAALNTLTLPPVFADLHKDVENVDELLAGDDDALAQQHRRARPAHPRGVAHPRGPASGRHRHRLGSDR